jgi:hypothetical protein
MNASRRGHKGRRGSKRKEIAQKKYSRLFFTFASAATSARGPCVRPHPLADVAKGGDGGDLSAIVRGCGTTAEVRLARGSLSCFFGKILSFLPPRPPRTLCEALTFVWLRHRHAPHLCNQKDLIKSPLNSRKSGCW